MPFRDHFPSPLDDFTRWEGFHGQWPAVIVQHLGKRLPLRYVAAPRVHSGSEVEIDVAAYDLEDGSSSSPQPRPGDGGVATAVWAPAQSTPAVETELPGADESEAWPATTSTRSR